MFICARLSTWNTPDGVGAAEVVVHRLVAHVELPRSSDHAARASHVQQAILQQREHAEAEQVDLDQADGIEVVLSHWITVRPGIEAGSMGTMVRQRLAGEHEAAHVDRAMARELVQSLDDVGEQCDARVVGIEAGLGEDGSCLGGAEQRGDRVAALDVVLLRMRGHASGHALHRIGLRLRLGAGNHLLTQRVARAPASRHRGGGWKRG